MASENNEDTGWVDRLSRAKNVVARRSEVWRERKMEEERCTNTIYVEIVIDNTQRVGRR